MHDLARDVILIGASAGGVQAIGKVLSELPSDLGAAVAVTLHRGRHASGLKDVFGARSNLEVVEVEHGESFVPGRVYLAPPDFHLTFSGGIVLLNHGPKENYARPAIDVMFRSAARNYGSRVVGVVLTGNLSDGVAGLQEIKRCGGLSLAQEPAEAQAPSMPLNAVMHDHVDIVFLLSAAGRILSKLVEREGVAAALDTHGARRPESEPLLS